MSVVQSLDLVTNGDDSGPMSVANTTMARNVSHCHRYDPACDAMVSGTRRSGSDRPRWS